MSITLAGVFDSDTEARAACNRLEAAGIDRRMIQVTANSNSGSSEDIEDRRGFFQKLFGIGDDDDSSYHYSEAVRRGNSVVTVELANESRIDEVCRILEDAGAVDVDERVEDWRASGYAPPVGGEATAAREGEQTLRSVEEQLNVGKRTVLKGRVRVHRTTEETPVEEQVTLRDEKASIQRRKVDRPATEADVSAAFKDEDIEIRESAEVPVVEKTARVVEEVTVGKKSAARTETVKERVRRSRIDVEDTTDVPDDEWSYSGPERRKVASRPYTGVERRVNPW
jgi:uncharacterized protein (TIGR02271 family)